MKFIPRALVTTALLSTFVVLAGGASSDRTLEEIAPYRQWNRITLEPLVITNEGSAGG